MVEIDRLSGLPDDLIDKIFTCLPIKDAARTSILSRIWKCKFSKLPYLKFSRLEFPHNPEADVVSAVDQILLLHRAPVVKVRIEGFSEYAALDRWITYLSQVSKTTTDFKIQFDDNDDYQYQLPMSFYAWQNLANLVCSKLSLTLPAQFAGFARLKSLELQSVRINESDLENLIAGCPELERLTINLCQTVRNFKIKPRGLEFFYLRSYIESLNFENSNSLTHIVLRNRMRFHRFSPVSSHVFARLPQLQFLDIDSFSLEFLTAEVEQRKVPIMCESLKYLVLMANWNNEDDCLRARCLFNMCHNIIELSVRIVSISVTESCFSNIDIGDHMFTKLRHVMVTWFVGTEPELDFIEFVLSTSPVLEFMDIKPASTSLQPAVLEKLATFRQNSPHVRISWPLTF